MHCYGGETHGSEDLSSAFANSCNAAFSKIGTLTDPKKLLETGDALLFNQDLPISIASSKSRLKLATDADPWTMMQTAIGQGDTMMRPLHEVILSAAIANGGVLVEPTLLRQVQSADGKVVKTFGEGAKRTLMSAEEALTLGGFMRRVVTEGTASALRKADYEAAGKTGSAETSDDKTIETNSWYTGFIRDSRYPYAIAVVIEQGGAGSRLASELAGDALKYAIELNS